ncbi:MAG: antibiotic biosynthesis monooxygenase [Pyrinomonadaceae bacterium]|nr:antibiotic biosynthesis monooxygenase [Pyrinomonadaceae bacterium]
MVFMSVTRLRVRSLRYLVPFIWRTLHTARQAEQAEGFLGGKLLREARNAFWTVTAWESEAAMLAYRNAGEHRDVMPKLLDWCDEASVVHWQQDGAELPNWLEAHRRISAEGRLSKVRHPSPDQEAKRIPAPHPGIIQRPLKPALTRAATIDGTTH